MQRLGGWFVLLVFALGAGAMSTAQAVQINLPGSNCHAANVSQGAFLGWDKNGITNNDPSRNLFVICPIPYDQDEGLTNMDLDMTLFLPASTALNDGLDCFLRFFEANSTGDEEFGARHNEVLNLAFQAGDKDFPGFGDIDADGAGGTVTTDNDGNIHLLCRLTPGATIMYYNADFF